MPDDAITKLFGNGRGHASDQAGQVAASSGRPLPPGAQPPTGGGSAARAGVHPPPPGGTAPNRGRHPVINVTPVDSGTRAHPTRIYGQSIFISVSPMALTWGAINIGGALPPAANWWNRFMFRISSIANLWAFVEAQNDEWRATTVYRQIETSDKGQASYRIGTLMAGIAGHYALDIDGLIHRQTQFGSSSLSRADFLGRRRTDGTWHGIEAKGVGPHLNTGQAQPPPPKKLVKAKLQAKGLGAELRQRPLPVGADDHWAVHSLASTTDAFELLIEDPPGDDGEPPSPLDPEVGFPGDEPEERLLQNYYQVVGDIQEAREFSSANVRREPQPLDGYRGFQMPGSALWIGAHEDLFAARNEQRLARIMDDITAITVIDEPAIYADLGLAVVILPVVDA